MASVLQVNISPGGVPKRAIARGVVTKRGLQGDQCANLRYHGGPQQALLLIGTEAYEELIAQGYPLFLGALGENITTQGLDRREMRIGQRYRLGSAMIELTKMRKPCKTLNVYGPSIQQAVYDKQVKAGDASSPRWGLGGFYAAVVQEGEVQPGDSIVAVDHVV